MKTTSEHIAPALGAALLLLLVAVAPKWIPARWLGADTAQRALGVVMGCIVLVYANIAPKTLIPLARLRCDPVTEQALRRFCARALVLGGLAYAAIWIVAPIDLANILAGSALAMAMLAVVMRCVRVRGQTPST